MNSLGQTGMLLLAVMTAWLTLADNGLAEDKYLAIDTVEAAVADYDTGATECNSALLIRAGETLHRVLDTLRTGSQLGLQYQKLPPKIAYMLGWCHYRRAEITGYQAQFDSSVTWFSRVSEDAKGEIGAYAKQMIGEVKLLQVVSEKYDLLCQDALDESALNRLQSLLSYAHYDFSSASQLLASANKPTGLSQIKMADVINEQARLYRAAGDAGRAAELFDSVDYPKIDLSVGDNSDVSSEYTRYCEATVELDKFLLAPDDYDVSALRSQYRYFDGDDRSLRLGAIAMAADSPTDAIGQFDASAQLVDRSRQAPLIPEAEYFRASALLDSSVVDNLLHTQVVSMLRQARVSFEAFEARVDSAGFGDDARLRQLVTKARHKYRLLGIAEGKTMSDQQLARLSRAEVKFLIRIAASIVGTPRARCTAALSRFFDLRDNSPSLGSVSGEVSESCTSRTDTLGADEALFLRGLVVTLQAEAMGGMDRFRTFEAAAGMVGSVRGQYEGEAKYVQAYALYKAEKYQEADLLFKEMISRYHSVRALYYYGMNLRDWHGDAAHDTINAMICASMQKVTGSIEAAGKPTEYRNFRESAGIMQDSSYIRYFTNNPDSVLNTHGVRAQNVACPDVLSVDASGAWPDTVLYENMSDKRLIRDKFAQESREDFAVYGLPKLWLLPSGRSCAEGSILAHGSFIVPDDIDLERVWRGRFEIVASDGNVITLDSCWAECVEDNARIICKDSANGRFIVLDADIKTKDSVDFRAVKSGFYRTFVRITSNEPGYADRKLVLARKVSYRASQYGDDPYDYAERPHGPFSFNLAAYAKSQKPPSQLTDDFAKDRDLRDFAYDSKNERYLAVSSRLGHELLIYPGGGKVDTLRLGRSVSLNSPEGIAVDKDGNIFIADWGNHRVVALDNDGKLRFSFNALAETESSDPTIMSNSLVFPNRITVEQDMTNELNPREMHILVSDYRGVHKFDSRGRYLDTPIRFDGAGIAAGSGYEITMDEYGPGSRMRLHTLKKGEPRSFQATR